MKACWTTADGQHIPYPKLSDKHLRNIIKDGYRNPNIVKEAKKRGFEIPSRPIDSLTDLDVCIWLEAFASCAIEGNVAADRMLQLWESDKALFYHHLNAWMMQSTSKKPIHR